MKENNDFKFFLEKHSGEKHIIIQTGNPDPDSISCALAHQLIAKEYNIDCDILYENNISHQQNLALVNLLNIDMLKFDSKKDFTKYSHAIFVDNQANSSIIIEKLKKDNVQFALIVDHHQLQNLISPELAHIEKVQAAATLYIEYLKNGIIDNFAINPDCKKISTALMLALRTETNNFLTAKKRDLEAAAFISDYIDHDIFNEIVNTKRSHEVVETFQKAIKNRKIVNGYSIAGICFLSSKHRDALPQIADFLLTEENIHTSICFGIIIKENGEEYINGSLRTCNLNINADTFIKECFGCAPNNQPYGGGKISMGAFEIPLNFLSGNIHNSSENEFMKLKWQVYYEKICECIFKTIGVSHKDNNDINI